MIAHVFTNTNAKAERGRESQEHSPQNPHLWKYRGCAQGVPSFAMRVSFRSLTTMFNAVVGPAGAQDDRCAVPKVRIAGMCCECFATAHVSPQVVESA